jgi:sialate O-acetylesterase
MKVIAVSKTALKQNNAFKLCGCQRDMLICYYTGVDFPGLHERKYPKLLERGNEMTFKIYSCLAVFFLSLSGLPGYADVALHPLFTENMVLQQKIDIPVWGTASDGEKITVAIHGQSKSTVARNGEWMLRLSPMDAGGPFTMTVEGNNTLTLNNVLVGEVWVCSGQSNMQWTTGATEDAYIDVPNARNDNIRLFYVPRTVAGTPQKTVNAKWEECTPQTVVGFSAVAYYFGKSLNETLDIPIGLIHTSWGGTPAESWTTRETLEKNALYEKILQRWENDRDTMLKEIPSVGEKMNHWLTNSEQQEKEGQLVSGMPSLPRDQYNNPWRPAGLYNAMIAPLIPYAIQGAIWYQGESNAGRAYQYRQLFQDMITDWRRGWGQGNFPFLFVQLANFGHPWAERHEWPELREAQCMALDLPETGMAVTMDIGDPYDIHPRNKKEVGRRLALSALHTAYDLPGVYSGPMYSGKQTIGDTIRLSFTQTGGGLVAKDDRPLASFEIAGDDQVFHTAKAYIKGNYVYVYADEVKKPAAVRYAWRNCPDASLFNKEGLPASPFRTDIWPGLTIDAR